MRARIIETGVTRIWLCDEVGIVPMTLYRYEIGERTPDTIIAQKIAKALYTTAEELFPLPSKNNSSITQNNNTPKPKKEKVI